MNDFFSTVAVLVAITALVVAFARRSRTNTHLPLPSPQQLADFPPKPNWRPALPVDIPRTINAFIYYTDSKKAFAIFTHGTCVVLPDDTTNAEEDAKEILDAVYRYHPDFNPHMMDDGNYMVSYSQPAYSIVFTDEFEAHREYIERTHRDGIVRDEVMLNANGQVSHFDDRGKAGLFGRARMFMDAQEPVVIRIWKP